MGFLPYKIGLPKENPFPRFPTTVPAAAYCVPQCFWCSPSGNSRCSPPIAHHSALVVAADGARRQSRE